MKFRHAAAAITALLVMNAAAGQTATPANAATAPAPASAPAMAGMESTAALKPGDATAGQGKAAVCGACHGMDGNSTDPQNPRLAGQSEQYIVAQLGDFKSGKRMNPIMLGFAQPLSEQDMHDIGAYFATKASLPGVADQALVDQGQTLYRQGDADRGIPACMACHGPDGRGNPGARYPQLTSQHAKYLEARLKGWHDGGTPTDDAHTKIMVGIAEKLDDKDIAAVASYIEGLHTNEPTAATPATP